MKRYFFLSFKNLAKSLPSLLALLTMLIFFAGASLFTILSNGDTPCAKIGLVGDTDDAYIKMASVLLEDTAEFEAVVLEEEEAKKLLLEEEILGYAVIPEDFVESAMRGKNLTLDYYLLKKPSALAHTLTKEIVSSVSVLLTESQRSVYGMRQFLKDTDRRERLDYESDKMSFSIVKKILERKDFFTLHETGGENSLTTKEHYSVSIIFTFVLTLGMALARFIVKSSASLMNLLSLRGLSPEKQIISEWLSYLLFISLFALPLSSALGFSFFKIIPALALLTAFQFIIYEAAASLTSAVLGQFFFSFVFAYLSGYFYPSYLFPDALVALSELLPTKVAIKSAGEGFIIPTLLYTAALLALSSLIRRKKMAGGKI